MKNTKCKINLRFILELRLPSYLCNFSIFIQFLSRKQVWIVIGHRFELSWRDLASIPTLAISSLGYLGPTTVWLANCMYFQENKSEIHHSSKQRSCGPANTGYKTRVQGISAIPAPTLAGLTYLCALHWHLQVPSSHLRYFSVTKKSPIISQATIQCF